MQCLLLCFLSGWQALGPGSNQWIIFWTFPGFRDLGWGAVLCKLHVGLGTYGGLVELHPPHPPISS